MNPMTKFQLFSLLAQKGTSSVQLNDGSVGILTSIEREDGSGSSFMVRVNCQGVYRDFHVRTID